jgi:hypothetical protein
MNDAVNLKDGIENFKCKCRGCTVVKTPRVVSAREKNVPDRKNSSSRH